jgi:hypothetical protein
MVIAAASKSIRMRLAPGNACPRPKHGSQNHFKMVRYPELGGTMPLVYRLGSHTVSRLYCIQPKLVVPFRVAPNELDLINHRRSLHQTLGLQNTDKNHGAVRQHAPQGNVLSRKIIPGQIRLLHKKSLIFIPTGHFDATALTRRQGFRIDHGHNSRENQKQLIYQPKESSRLERKELRDLLKKKNQMMCEKDTEAPICVPL